jgi:7-cyano-7-deazaguanine synthase
MSKSQSPYPNLIRCCMKSQEANKDTLTTRTPLTKIHCCCSHLIRSTRANPFAWFMVRFHNDEKGRARVLVGAQSVTTAVVLLSGGIDSATALYLTKQETAEVYTMNVIYAETYDREAEASERLAARAHVKEHISILLPFYNDLEKRYHPPPSHQVSSAYIPARNIVFYGVATAYAEILGADRVVFGSNADDARSIPDATPAFIQLMNQLVRVGTRVGQEGRGIEIVNPLIEYTKTEVLKLAIKLGVPLELTWSCYENGQRPCGRCRGCRMRLKAFEEVGARDPLQYAEST